MAAIDRVVHEITLFASAGFVVGGIDDLAIDVIHFVRTAIEAVLPHRRLSPTIADLPQSSFPPLAIFVAAWDEAGVIGAMLRSALRSIDYPDYRICVGTYPNDRATIDAVAAVAEEDARVRLVIGPCDGPTTKADCLNAIWRATIASCDAGAAPLAVVLHDAEDVIHAQELRIHAALAGDYDIVQLPVAPLADPRSRMVGGHYCDEFSEAHAKSLPVRQALGAAIPLAGVGCAITTAMLRAIAAERADGPFDATSLTEDYELGLTVTRLGGRSVFARIAEAPGAPPIAVRAYFPARLDAAVRQKARWMTGIALAGWDRTGWAPRGHWRDHWMRMRDRRALLAVLVLIAGYAAIVLGALAIAAHRLTGTAPPALTVPMRALLTATAMLLVWRLCLRAWFTGRRYGPAEALRSVPRAIVGNIIAMIAARKAVLHYLALLRGRKPVWDKTSHRFPPPEIEKTLR